MSRQNSISLVIADDHPLMLKGLSRELTSHGYHILAQAPNGALALQHILSLRPTITLLDIDMPVLSGFEVVKLAREKGSQTKFILLSFHKEADFLWRAKELQVYGYLLKEDSFNEIERCILSVADGQPYFSQSLARNIAELTGSRLETLNMLTPSEMKILKLISNGYSSGDIAAHLNVSVRTVEKHRSNILAKIGIEGSTNALTSWALTNKATILQF